MPKRDRDKPPNAVGIYKLQLHDHDILSGRGGASNKHHCTKHGWGRHSSARCYTLHPEKAPAGWVVNPKDGQK